MTEPTVEFVVVLCTVPDAETGRALARSLLDRRLAACVNVLPGLTSIYRWEGVVHEDAEALLVIKTRRALFEPLADALTSAHPYDTPEILALPVSAGAPRFLDWLRAETGRIVDPPASG